MSELPTFLSQVDGKRYQVEGYVWDDATSQWRCPTEKCQSYCCKTGSIWPKGPVPCEFLRKDLKCTFHVRGGVGAKPFGCVSYPRSQEDVDHMNKNAKGEFRCYLTVKEVTP